MTATINSALTAWRPPSTGDVPAPDTPSMNWTIINPNSAALSLVAMGDQRPINAITVITRAMRTSSVPRSPWAPKLLSLNFLLCTVVKAPQPAGRTEHDQPCKQNERNHRGASIRLGQEDPPGRQARGTCALSLMRLDPWHVRYALIGWATALLILALLTYARAHFAPH